MEDMMKKMLVKLSVGLAVATSLLAGTANAQPIMKGTFTLPYDVRWGSSLLTAGTYTIVIDSAHRPALVSTQAGMGRALVFAQVVNDASKDLSTALVITRGETGHTVRALNWREGNRSFVYKPFTKAERTREAKADKDIVAIRMAQN
jgi:hypothetical protein